jgi:nucleoid-associated protein YgaU
VATVVTSGLGILAGHAVAGASHPAPQRARVYVVRPGDTLWAIASRVAGRGADPRPVVDALIDANHLTDASLAPGTALRLPRSH